MPFDSTTESDLQTRALTELSNESATQADYDKVADGDKWIHKAYSTGISLSQAASLAQLQGEVLYYMFARDTSYITNGTFDIERALSDATSLTPYQSFAYATGKVTIPQAIELCPNDNSDTGYIISSALKVDGITLSNLSCFSSNLEQAQAYQLVSRAIKGKISQNTFILQTLSNQYSDFNYCITSKFPTIISVMNDVVSYIQGVTNSITDPTSYTNLLNDLNSISSILQNNIAVPEIKIFNDLILSTIDIVNMAQNPYGEVSYQYLQNIQTQSLDLITNTNATAASFTTQKQQIQVKISSTTALISQLQSYDIIGSGVINKATTYNLEALNTILRNLDIPLDKTMATFQTGLKYALQFENQNQVDTLFFLCKTLNSENKAVANLASAISLAITMPEERPNPTVEALRLEIPYQYAKDFSSMDDIDVYLAGEA